MLALIAAAALALGSGRWSGMDAAVDAAARAGLAGEVLVSDRRRTLYARAVSAPGRPHRPGARWRWASVTKQLTAVLVLQAVDAGRLRLDDTLSARLPAFRGSTAGAVTLRQLLQHTSGLPDPSDTPAASADAFPSFYTRRGLGVGGTADALGFCAGAPRARPGAAFHYDNCDYIVLGAVLERAEGRRLRRLVRERLAAPAGAPTLDLATDAQAQAGLVRPPGEPPFNLAAFGAAGAAYGRAEDLARFDRAWMGDRLMSPASRAAAEAGDPRLGYVALGAWGFSAPLRGCAGPVRLLERRGEIGGVEVRNLMAPDIGRALVVFADRADLDFGEIWQGEGLTWRLAGAAFCPAPAG